MRKPSKKQVRKLLEDVAVRSLAVQQSMLLSDAIVERAITLMALIELATNPVTKNRYLYRLKILQRHYPEVLMLTSTDLRVAAKVIELRKEFEEVEGKSV